MKLKLALNVIASWQNEMKKWLDAAIEDGKTTAKVDKTIMRIDAINAVFEELDFEIQEEEEEEAEEEEEVEVKPKAKKKKSKKKSKKRGRPRKVSVSESDLEL